MFYSESLEGTVFRQRFLFQQQLLTIEEEWLSVKEKTPFSTENHAVAYEEMGSYLVQREWHSQKAITISAGLLLISLMIFLSRPGDTESIQAALGYGLVGAIILAFYLVTYKNVAGLSFPDKASTQQVRPAFLLPLFASSTPGIEAFVKKVMVSRNKYLLERYTHFTTLIEYDAQLGQLTMLNRAGVLNNQEFLQFREQLTQVFKQDKGIIGFQKPPVVN